MNLKSNAILAARQIGRETSEGRAPQVPDFSSPRSTTVETEKWDLQSSPHLNQRVMSGLNAAKATIASEFSTLCKVQQPILQAAFDEADALAWKSGFPHLVFPTLAEEKIRT